MLYARFVATVPYLLMSTKCWDFLTPSWLPCHIQKSADFVPFVCFLGTPLPGPSRCGRHIWKAPYVVFQCRSQKNTWVMWLMLLCTDFRGICSLLASSPCFWQYLADTPSSDAIFSWGITIHYLRSENGPPNLKIQSTLAFRYPQQNLEVRENSDCPLVCVT